MLTSRSMVSAAGIVENFVAHEYPTEKVKKLLDINVMGKSLFYKLVFEVDDMS